MCPKQTFESRKTVAEETEQQAAKRRARAAEQSRRNRAKRTAIETADQAAARKRKVVLRLQQSRAARSSVRMPNDRFNDRDIRSHSCGKMDQECTYCHSVHFKDEKPTDGSYKYCCRKGTVLFDAATHHHPFPPYLQELFRNTEHPHYRKFHANIRAYNSAMAFASTGTNIDDDTSAIIRMHGQIYHRTLPRRTLDKRQYDELYVVDYAMANHQQTTDQLIDIDVLTNIKTSNCAQNVYAPDYRMLNELDTETTPIVNMTLNHSRQLPVDLSIRRVGSRCSCLST